MKAAHAGGLATLFAGMLVSGALACAQEPAAVSREGARHWSFQPVRRPTVPEIPGLTSQNPIDAFVAQRLAQEGLALSPEADRATLIRRLYLVMLGVPPRPEAVAAFVADPEPRAFEHLVDVVLADRRYGERWGRHWLDVIRFAETNGFETNRERPNAWQFRDYVIAAWNDDLPYDQFVREQLAGDALGADVATGFLVGGPQDIVGSPDPVLTAQQRADELDDMVATTGTAFLGLTIGCARCHSHKFDPIAQSEYYSLTAVFAGVRHGERDLPLPEERAAEVRELDARIASLDRQLAPFVVVPVPRAAPADGGPLRAAVDFVRNEESFAPVDAKFVRFTIFATTGAEPCLDELEVWAGDRNVALATNGALVTASGTLSGYDIHKLEHLNDGLFGNSHSWISDEVGGGWVQIELPQNERIDRIVWGRDRDGVVHDRLAVNYCIEVAEGLDHWHGIASSADRAPWPGESVVSAVPHHRFDATTAADVAEVAQARAWLAERQELAPRRAALAQAPKVYAGTFTEPGAVHLLERGDPMRPGDLVVPATLALFRPMALAGDAPEQQRRLRLSQWITDPAHPLTARVLVNRVWQHQFGTGLVSTPSDFGRNGARPSHPELLDWLASEFVAGGYHIKALQRLILTSAVWRQASAPRQDAMRIDAGSRLLWRFPPQRLEAEAIRDSILATSGDLDPTMGGPSFFLHDVDRENVYHYHPKERFGAPEMRRMVYALKVRMEQDAVFGAFDCPDGSLVMPKRGMSTTPLQSLNLWNSEFLLQQADVMAARCRREVGGAEDGAAAVQRAWQLAFQREPLASELGDAITFVQSEGLPALCRALLNSNEFLFVP
jgi:hypothetical protein